MRESTRYFLLFYGLWETFIFTGNIFGWNALLYMLRQEGIYEHVCEYNSTDYDADSTIATDAVNETIARTTCEEQDRLLNLAYTIGSFCIGSTSVIWGFLLDKWGLRNVRILINFLITSGTILLSLTIKETSFLLFPSLVLMCLAGVPLRLANMQIADLFPKQRSTIITLYSGAFTASASVFVFVKYGFDAGLPWEWACFMLACISVLMLPVTLFVLPVDRIKEHQKGDKLFPLADKEVTAVAPCVWGTYTPSTGSPSLKKKSEPEIATICKAKEDIKKAEKEEESKAQEVKEEIALRYSLMSVSFWLHQYWFCWLLLYTIMYVGTLHLWSERTSSNPRDGALFSETYGLFQVTGILLAPIGGIFMDWSINRVSKDVEEENDRMLKVLQSCFWPMFLTTILEAVAQGCKFFDVKIAIYISIVAVTLLRAFFIAIGTAYLRIRFPAEHFNRLLGIMSTMSALFTLFQFPLFLWESSSADNVLYVNIFDSICLGVAFIHPLLLLVTPLQKHFLAKEKTDMLKTCESKTIIKH